MMKLPKAVAFDWDGTLAETRNAVVSSLEYVLKKYNKESWDIVKVKYRDKNKSLKDNFINFFGDDYMEAYDDYLDYYQELGINNVIAKSGVVELLEWLKNKDIKLYIISNKDNMLLEKEVKQCFKYNVFEKIIGEAKKPSPDIIFSTFKYSDFEINEENIWFVGDTNQDFDCAKNANILPILVGKANFMGGDEVTDVLKFENYEKLLENLDDFEINA